jgi:hypothetical protein
MKTIIAGSRTINSYAVVEQAIKDSGFKITEIVCGMARGVDYLGKLWGFRNNVPVNEMPAYWGTYGRSAGVRRNKKMAEYAEALIAIWDGRSPGTGNMIEEARAKGLRVFVALQGRSGEKSPVIESTVGLKRDA